jgi:hypothetical protein
MKNWKQLERHPLSAEYADLTPAGREQMRAGLREHGIIGDRRITLYEGKVLDGWQLYQACVDEDIEPKFQELPEGVDPVVFVEIQNDRRRHEDMDTIMRRAQARCQRVVAARQEGQSLRAIARQEEVSESQVRADLKAATAQGCAVGPPDGKVTGLDGKVRPAAQPKLIPEVAQMGLSPKFTPPLEALPRGKQQDFVRLVNGGMSVRAALKSVENLRQPGDDTEQIKSEKAAEKAKPKIGAEKFDWKEFHGHFRALMRMPDRVGDAYDPKCKNTPQADALRKKLDDWEKGFKVWFRDIAKQEPPKE